MEVSFINVFLHLDVFLKQLTVDYGVWIYAILFLVIFCETGLVVMPFLPGDSLLFVAGAVAATGGMNPYVLAATLMIAAILGDSTNYIIGRNVGERLFSRPNSRIFRRDHLARTHAFYEAHGGKTVALARFLPVVRTFAPFVAGVGRMSYPRFLFFSVLGSIVWVGSLVGLGYLFGNVEFVKKNLSIIIVAVLGISLVPVVVPLLRQRLLRNRAV